MSLGIFFVLVSILGFSLSNITQIILSRKFHVSEGLTFQYAFLSLFSGIYLMIMESFQFSMTFINIGIILMSGIIGYLGVFFFYKGFKYLPVGIVLIISFAYTFLSYFLNNFLFPGIEVFSTTKLILAAIFFISVGFFLLEKDHTNKHKMNIFVVYPILTAICWTIYYGASNYLIKSHILSPVQTIFYAEGIGIFIVSMLIILPKIKIRIQRWKKEKISKAYFGLSLVSASFAFIGSIGLCYGYKLLPGNLVNFMGLSQVIFSSLFAYIFLKEKLSKREMLSIVISLIILTIFLII